MRHVGETSNGIWTICRTIYAAVIALSIISSLFVPPTTRAQNVAVQIKRFKPELVVQTGHSGEIASMAISPNGKMIASGGADQTLRLWDIETGKELHVFSGHKTRIGSLAFSPDGKILAAEAYFSIKLWDVTSGRELIPAIQLNWNVNSLAFSPDGKMIAGGGNDQTTSVWDVTNGKELWKFGEVKGYEVDSAGVGHVPAEAVNAIAFSPNDNKLASATADGKVKLWNLGDGTLIKTLSACTSAIRSLIYSPDGKKLITASEGEIKVWDATTRDLVNDAASKAIDNAVKNIASVALAPDGNSLAVVDVDSDLNLFSVDERRKPTTFQRKTGGKFNLVAFSPDGETIATGGSGVFGNSEIKLWDKSNGKEIRKLEGYANKLYTIGLSPSGSKLAVADDYSTIHIWNLSGGNAVKSISAQDGHTVRTITSDSTGLPSITFSPDSNSIAVGSFAGTEIFDADTGKLQVKLDGAKLDYSGNPLAYMPDGKSLVIAGDKDLSLWDLKTASIAKTFGRYSLENWLSRPTSIAVDPSGRYLAGSSTDGTTRLWDVNSGKEVRSLCGQKSVVDSLAFSPDGKLIATAEKLGNFTVCDVATGDPVFRFEEGGGSLNIESVAFSPDSRKIAAMDIFGKIRFWDLGTTNLLGTFVGQADSDPKHLKNAIAFSPNGKVLFSTSGRAKIDVWDLAENKKAAALVSIGRADWAVVTPDGYFDASDGAQELMHFVVNGPQIGYETIALDQLKSRFWIPGLLKNVVDGKPPHSSAEFSITLFPDIKIEQAKPDVPSLKIDLRNRGGGIGRVEVRVNGSEITSNARGRTSIATQATDVSLQVDIAKERLRPGDNKVEVIAWNLEGNVQSRSEAVFLNLADNGLVSRGTGFVDNKANKPASQVDYYAIVSGISNYGADSLNLRYAAKDAEDMARALTVAARKYFCADEMASKKPCTRVHVRLLSTETNKDAQFSGLADVPDFRRLDPVKGSYEKTFDYVAKAARADDVVTLYFSGHATSISTDEAVRDSAIADTYLYATREAITLDRSVLANKTEREAKTVSSLELSNWLSDIKAEKKVLILDTCAAGAVQKDLIAQTRDVDALQTKSIERLRARTGFYVLMGSAANAQSFEANEYRQGLLTYSLLEGMTIDGKLRDGRFLDVEKWFGGARDRVEDLAKGIGGVQEPSYFKSYSANSFDIGRIESDERKEIPLASRVPLILRPELRENGKHTDVERLTERLEEGLAEQSIVITRGRAASINYINAETAMNGFSPRGDYTVNGDQITIEVSLIRNEIELAKVKVTGSRNDVIKNLIQEILKALPSGS